MNWFERYGIPGFYFVFLNAVIYYFTFQKQLIFAIDQIGEKFLIGFLITIAIPIGYCITIFEQLLYYHFFDIHTEALKKSLNIKSTEVNNNPHYLSRENINDKLRNTGFQLNILNRYSFFICIWNIFKSIIICICNIIKSIFSKTNNQDCVKEWESEIVSVVVGCINLQNDQIKKGQWLQAWINKRMDVLAINFSIILATIISWGIYVSMILIKHYYKNGINWPVLIIIIVSIAIVLILFLNYKVISNQLKQILSYCFKNYFDYIKEKQMSKIPEKNLADTSDQHHFHFLSACHRWFFRLLRH